MALLICFSVLLAFSMPIRLITMPFSLCCFRFVKLLAVYRINERSQSIMRRPIITDRHAVRAPKDHFLQCYDWSTSAIRRREVHNTKHQQNTLQRDIIVTRHCGAMIHSCSKYVDETENNPKDIILVTKFEQTSFHFYRDNSYTGLNDARFLKDANMRFCCLCNCTCGQLFFAVLRSDADFSRHNVT